MRIGDQVGAVIRKETKLEWSHHSRERSRNIGLGFYLVTLGGKCVIPKVSSIDLNFPCLGVPIQDESMPLSPQSAPRSWQLFTSAKAHIYLGLIKPLYIWGVKNYQAIWVFV